MARQELPSVPSDSMMNVVGLSVSKITTEAKQESPRDLGIPRAGNLRPLAELASRLIAEDREAYYREHGLRGNNRDFHRWLASRDQ